MSTPTSRPPSTVLDIEDDLRNGSDRKANTDSGFHEEEYSTPTPSTSGGKRHYHHSRRRPTPPPRDDDDDEDEDDDDHKIKPHPRHPSHDSLLSRFSDLQDYNSINFDYGGSNSESSTTSVESPPKSQQGNYVRKLGKKFAPAPMTPPPTSCGLDGKDPAKEYEFPSDTELSEIIAIMSGIASPRKQNGKVFHTKSQLHPHNEEGDDGEDVIHSFEEQKPPLPPQPRLRRGESLNLYEKRPIANGNAGGGNNNSLSNNSHSNGGIPNGTLNRRFLPKQGKSLDAVSISGSETGLRMNDLNRSKSSVNSLNSILMASKAGTLPNMPKKKKKVKKKPPPPPKRDEGEEPGDFGNKNKISWKQRLKLSLTLLVSVLLILSSSSLLFIVPIVVDPILVGLEAQFSHSPAQCRTVSKRNGTGSLECTTPSCREGCTADLMFCYFIDVEYVVGVYNTSAKSLVNNNYLNYNHSDSPQDQNDSFVFHPSPSRAANLEAKPLEADLARVESVTPPGTAREQRATLLVNPSGCGYPPEINCSDFDKKYGEINYTFPCYYSNQNESIVVPFYSRDMEILILSISLIIPCGSSLLLSGCLYLLLKWKPNPYQRKRKKKVKEDDPPPASDPKLRKDQNGMEDSMRLNLNGSVPKANSALGNIMGDLTGITAKNVMRTHNYTKFHSSISVSHPNSGANSRQASISRGESLDLELKRIEEQQEAEKISNHKPLSSASASISKEDHRSGVEDNYNFNHVKSSKYNEKDFANGHLLSNGHIPSDTNKDSNDSKESKGLSSDTDQDSLLPNHTSVWLVEGEALHQRNQRKGSEDISNKSSSRPSTFTNRTPQVSSISKVGRRPRDSITSVESLDSAKTISFGKL